MLIKEILQPERTLYQLPSVSKKRVLEKVSQHLSLLYPNLNANELFDAFIERERLGSTGIGDGVALPHCRSSRCNEIIGVLALLKNSIDFDSIDGKEVDLVFILVVPKEASQDHLNTLSSVASAFYKESYRDTLRNAENAEELFLLATHIESSSSEQSAQ